MVVKKTKASIKLNQTPPFSTPEPKKLFRSSSWISNQDLDQNGSNLQSTMVVTSLPARHGRKPGLGQPHHRPRSQHLLQPRRQLAPLLPHGPGLGQAGQCRFERRRLCCGLPSALWQDAPGPEPADDDHRRLGRLHGVDGVLLPNRAGARQTHWRDDELIRALY